MYNLFKSIFYYKKNNSGAFGKPEFLKDCNCKKKYKEGTRKKHKIRCLRCNKILGAENDNK
jgi:hypothetical protein